MGTRSLTVFVDTSWDRNQEICVLYRQFDGYLSGHGKELYEFLKGMVVLNGIPGNPPPKFANGMGCLAAQVVAHFKRDRQGGYYLHAAGTRDIDEEYTYTLTSGFGQAIRLKVEAYGRTIYDGLLDAFNPDMDEAA